MLLSCIGISLSPSPLPLSLKAMGNCSQARIKKNFKNKKIEAKTTAALLTAELIKHVSSREKT